MFIGGGFGVGLTVSELGVPVPVLPAGLVERPARLSEVLPVAARTPAEKAQELGRVARLKAMIAAYEVVS